MLTDAKVRNAKPRVKAYKLTDSNRLFLLVMPAGGKLRRWNYAFDGKQKSLAFGAWLLVGLADARARRDEALTMLGEGRDPAVAKKLRTEANIEPPAKHSSASPANGTKPSGGNGRRGMRTSCAASSDNRAAYLPHRRELAQVWADMLCAGLSDPFVLVERPAHPTGVRSRRFNPMAVDAGFRFPVRRRAA